MDKTIKDLTILLLVCILSTFLIWLPHFLKLENFYFLNFSNGFETIYRNFDGLEYVVIAKSFYNPEVIKSLLATQPASYYPSHFPGFPFFIVMLAPFLGFLKSMLLTTQFFTVLSVWAFYFFIKNFKLTSHPLWLSIVFLVLPARWLVVHSIGSPEPLFICFVIATIYFVMAYEKNNQYYYLLLAAFCGILAQTTRPPAILLFIALAIYIHWKHLFLVKSQGFLKVWVNHLKYFPLIFMPIAIFFIFYLFSVNLGDFWAYFHSGDNIHLTFPPYQVFNKHQFWVGDIWLEDIIYIFLFTFLGGFLLFKQKLYLPGIFVLTYLFASILVVHRDISRYTLPVVPFVLIAFEKILISKEFKVVLVILLLGIYLYAQNFIIENASLPLPNILLLN